MTPKKIIEEHKLQNLRKANFETLILLYGIKTLIIFYFTV